jgi:hypothetical protein
MINNCINNKTIFNSGIMINDGLFYQTLFKCVSESEFNNFCQTNRLIIFTNCTNSFDCTNIIYIYCGIICLSPERLIFNCTDSYNSIIFTDLELFNYYKNIKIDNIILYKYFEKLLFENLYFTDNNNILHIIDHSYYFLNGKFKYLKIPFSSDPILEEKKSNKNPDFFLTYKCGSIMLPVFICDYSDSNDKITIIYKEKYKLYYIKNRFKILWLNNNDRHTIYKLTFTITNRDYFNYLINFQLLDIICNILDLINSEYNEYISTIKFFQDGGTNIIIYLSDKISDLKDSDYNMIRQICDILFNHIIINQTKINISTICLKFSSENNGFIISRFEQNDDY